MSENIKGTYRSATIADKLSESGGRPSGFDYLRLGLALSVFVDHCFILPMTQNGLSQLTNVWFRPILAAIVPMFFALSGFLVTGSLERSKTMVTFLSLRVLRIAPALATEITVSAIILGAIFTELPLKTYFSSEGFGNIFLISSVISIFVYPVFLIIIHLRQK